MKMMRKCEIQFQRSIELFLVVLFVWFGLVACNPGFDQSECLFIDLDEKVEPPESGEDWVKTMRFVPLETNPEYML